MTTGDNNQIGDGNQIGDETQMAPVSTVNAISNAGAGEAGAGGDDVGAYPPITMGNRRLVRRIDSGGLPFFPFGFAPLAGLAMLFLFALTAFAHGVIQRSAMQSAERAVRSTDADWAYLETSGQWVYLSGRAPNRAAVNRTIASIRAGLTDTPAGPAIPVTRVIDNTTTTSFIAAGATPSRSPSPSLGADNAEPAGGAPPPEAGLSAAEEVPAQSVSAARLPDWSFTLAEGSLLLEGEAPNGAYRSAIEAAARDTIAPPRIARVDNRLVITDVADNAAARDAARRGIETLSACDRGVANFSNSVFRLRCQVPADAIETLTAVARAPLTDAKIGPINLTASEAVSQCDQELTSLLDRSSIRFATGSAAIADASSGLLDTIAGAASTCPGRLVIEGHTDSQGAARSNQALSLARAQAVRSALIARGIAPDILLAVGYGAERPRADNATAAGRAANRRIEIRVAPPGAP